MFDLCEPNLHCAGELNEVEAAGTRFPASLLEILSTLSDELLDELEDELNFYAFTGIQGACIQRLMPKCVGHAAPRTD